MPGFGWFHTSSNRFDMLSAQAPASPKSAAAPSFAHSATSVPVAHSPAIPVATQQHAVAPTHSSETASVSAAPNPPVEQTAAVVTPPASAQLNTQAVTTSVQASPTSAHACADGASDHAVSESAGVLSSSSSRASQAHSQPVPSAKGEAAAPDVPRLASRPSSTSAGGAVTRSAPRVLPLPPVGRVPPLPTAAPHLGGSSGGGGGAAHKASGPSDTTSKLTLPKIPLIARLRNRPPPPLPQQQGEPCDGDSCDSAGFLPPICPSAAPGGSDHSGAAQPQLTTQLPSASSSASVSNAVPHLQQLPAGSSVVAAGHITSAAAFTPMLDSSGISSLPPPSKYAPPGAPKLRTKLRSFNDPSPSVFHSVSGAAAIANPAPPRAVSAAAEATGTASSWASAGSARAQVSSFSHLGLPALPHTSPPGAATAAIALGERSLMVPMTGEEPVNFGGPLVASAAMPPMQPRAHGAALLRKIPPKVFTAPASRRMPNAYGHPRNGARSNISSSAFRHRPSPLNPNVATGGAMTHPTVQPAFPLASSPTLGDSDGEPPVVTIVLRDSNAEVAGDDTAGRPSTGSSEHSSASASASSAGVPSSPSSTGPLAAAGIGGAPDPCPHGVFVESPALSNTDSPTVIVVSPAPALLAQRYAGLHASGVATPPGTDAAVHTHSQQQVACPLTSLDATDGSTSKGNHGAAPITSNASLDGAVPLAATASMAPLSLSAASSDVAQCCPPSLCTRLRTFALLPPSPPNWSSVA